MRLRSLESRIVILFLMLILAVQLVGFLAIRNGIQRNVQTTVRNELASNERMFQRLLDQSEQKLTQGARLLASDHGFMQAIGTGDTKTIASALSSSSKRIDGVHAALVSLDHTIKASSAENLDHDLRDAILRLTDKAEQAGGAASANTIVGNHPYQIAVVAVRAPVTIGWVAMAFPFGRQIATDMRELSSLQVTILAADRDGKWIVDTSTLPDADALMLAQHLEEPRAHANFMPELRIGDSDFSARIATIAKDGDKQVVVVLQRSISEAIAPYRTLQGTLLMLAALGIALAAAGSIFMARRITRPLQRLGEIAKRLGSGDYKTQIDIRRDDEIGELSKAFVDMRDGIANREREIQRLAYWDMLTDLPNRAQFAKLLNEAIADANRHGVSCHVLMMDLDRFKNVNDMLGHSFGDALLRKVAQRLQAQLPSPACQLARLGGDEFAALLTRSSLQEAREFAGRILKALETPVAHEDQNVDLGAGVGIAGFPEHGGDAESLLSRAEVAMYAAKRSGNEAVVYDSGIDKGSQQNLSLLSELRRAAERNEFRLYVQPKLMLDSGAVAGAEALVRWAHPERGLVFPDNFIPFAEKTGFIRSITYWMLEHSAMFSSELTRAGLHLKLSVNLSARDLMDQDLPAKFAEILARHDATPALFCLEITESAIMDDPVRSQQTLEGLNAMGMELSIDDFGTGYSSLAYLKRLPVQELKIDKSFVIKMEHDAEDAKIVRSTIDLGHNLGLRVVAEGIEDLATWEMLAHMGCDKGQGYFMSRPIPADQLAAWIAAWQPPAPGGKRKAITAS